MSSQKLKRRLVSSSISSGPAPKKLHLESGPKTQSAPNTGRKRTQPITSLPKDEESDSHSEEEKQEEFEGHEMDVDPPYPHKDASAAREAHKVQRALAEQRRAAKPHSTLLADSKRLWSLARQKQLAPAERARHIQALMAVIQGKVTDIVFKHDASRIVQTVVKYGRQKERNEIALELKGKYRDLAQNKYSKFLVTKLIRLCPSHRASILLEFQSHVLRLLLHREASSVLADAFELYANAYERTILVRDFYGKETSLFSVTTGSEQDKLRAKAGLFGVLEGVDDERRKRVLNAMKDNLFAIFNNPNKGAVTHAVVHRALWEYLEALGGLSSEAEQEKLRKEMFESCQELLAEMVHTRDGSRVVRYFIAQGSAKDRKQIVKVLKPHVERMCVNDEAQLVLFTALDVIDDTKLTTKSLVTEITSRCHAFSATPQGRRSLFHLLVPRTTRHFTPAQIATLAETDGIRAKTSKKDADVRREEIRKAASEDLISFVEAEGSALAKETGGSLVVLEILLYAEGDKTVAMRSLLEWLSAPYPTADENHPHPIDLPHTSRMYKCLLQGGHFSAATGSIARSDSFSPAAFASAFVKIVGREVTVGMAKGNGAFVVAELCERLREEGSVEERECVKGWFGADELKQIEDGDGKGSRVLLEKVRVL